MALRNSRLKLEYQSLGDVDPSSVPYPDRVRDTVQSYLAGNN